LDDLYWKKISTLGRATNSEGVSSDVLIDIKYNKYSPDQIECQISSAETESARFAKLFVTDTIDLKISGFLENKTKLVVNDVHGYYLKGRTADLNIDSFSVGHPDKIPFNSGYILAEIKIPEAPAIEVAKAIGLSYLGEIENKRKDEDAIFWINEFGEFSIADFYEYENGKVGLSSTIHRIKVFQIVIKKKFAQSFIIEEIVPEIEKEIEDILWLLSFINRRRLFWYEINIKIIPVPDDREIWIPNYYKRRKSIISGKADSQNYLIGQNELAKGGFYKILQEYRNHPMKNEIRRAIIYTAVSYEHDTVEAQIQTIYLAVEVLVNSLSETRGYFNVLQKDSFKKLLKKVKEVVSAYFGDESKYKNEKSWLILNLLGLNTIPFIDRLIKCIGELDIEVLDFLNEPDLLKPTFENIQRRRNKLIHKGEIREPDRLIEDLIILRALSERFILELLKWPLDKTYISAFRSLHSLKS